MINVNEITTTLRGMPDRLLQQYAMMNKGNPYVLSLAVSESNQRKQLRQAAQARTTAPQPKVADTAIAGMSEAPAVDAMGNVTGMAAGGLPEDYGIGRLPTPNIQSMADGGIAGYGDGDDVPKRNGMAVGGMFDFAQRSEPVIRMAEGGMAGFSKGGLTDKQQFAMQYKDIAEKVGKELGVDPGIIIAQWGMETGWGKKTVGQYNFGNIKDVTGKGPRAYDKKEKSRDSYKSYESPDAFAADYAALIKRNFPDAVGAGADIGAFSSGLQSGKKGAYATDPNYEKVLANTFKNLPIGSAEAGKPQSKEPVPAKEPGLENAQDTARSTANAGLFSLAAPGVMASAKDAGNALYQKFVTSQPGLSTAQKYGRAAGAYGNTAATMAVPFAVLQGGVSATDKAMNDLQYMSEDQRRALAANPMLSAMSGDAGLASAIMDAAANNPEGPSKMSYADQMKNVGKFIVGHPDIERQRLAAEAKKPAKAEDTKPVYDPNKMEPVRYDEFGPINLGPELPKTEEKAVVEAAKEATPAKERKGFTNDDLLTLGLSLLASKSPNFMTALGEAGLATVAGKKEREKLEREEAKLKGSEELQRAQAKYYGAYAGAIERGAKEKNDELEAEKLVRQYMGDWEKNNKIANIQDPTARLQEEARIRQQIYASLGLTPIMNKQAAPAGAGDFKLVGVR